MPAQRINLDEPRYDQNTFEGRAKHFFITTNPLNLFASSADLDAAKKVVQRCRAGDRLPELSDDSIWRAKHLYDSAFHPDTKEKMYLIGRMSAQVPMNMAITGCMLTFYKTTPQTIFWQWINQSFNAVVNYTNRSGDSPISMNRLGLSYVLATGGAIGTSLGINSLIKSFPPVLARFVPFMAVATANCINIPCMRSREITEGIPIFDMDGNRLGESTRAAKSAITQVVFSRVGMATPGMLLPPVIMQFLEKKTFLKARPWMNAPVQTLLVGFFLVFMTPICCAFFPQKSSLAVASLEDGLRQRLEAMEKPPSRVYFNKGL